MASHINATLKLGSHVSIDRAITRFARVISTNRIKKAIKTVIGVGKCELSCVSVTAYFVNIVHICLLFFLLYSATASKGNKGKTISKE